MIEKTKRKKEERRAKGERSSRVSDSRMRLSISGVQQLARAKTHYASLQVLFAPLSSGNTIQFPSQCERTVTREGLESSWKFHLGILRCD